MLQRILQQGANRFAAGAFLNAGDAFLIDNPSGWIKAGVYRNGSRLIAVNRPAAEDDPDSVGPEAARQLFAPLTTFLFETRGGTAEALQGEIWRALLFAMLIFLVGESWLSLPPARSSANRKQPTATPRSAPLAGART
jgi:hypothetical protein